MKDMRTILKEEQDAVDTDAIGDDDMLMDDIVDLLFDIDPESLTDEQAEKLEDILDRIDALDDWDGDEADYDSDGVSEAAPARRVRRDKVAQREHARAYRRNKAQLKLKAKKYRKSAHGKLLAKKRERMAKRGLTATGQRKRSFINK